MSEDKKPLTALVTGANRGIGFEVCRQLALKGIRVVLTARDAAAGREAAAALSHGNGAILFAELDISQESSVQECAAKLRRDGVSVDILVNNAALSMSGALSKCPSTTAEDVLNTNALGAVRTCRAFVPPMLENGYGRVVNVSSGCGAFAEGLPGPDALYSISKAALNAFTLRLSREVSGDVKVNAVCPGWTQTRMGGPAAPRSAESGADSIVWLATLGPEGPNGGFFRDRQRIDW
ncbi:MAG: SDR family NAD(P)-dependent oxidoreductase [Elusimicrobiota bacterium]|jgi:NAD(P)-dependent dehydrogenase (short-subunit alcohol dehydrogenase family)